jgi:nicotinamide phosphoribosyltransferase
MENQIIEESISEMPFIEKPFDKVRRLYKGARKPRKIDGDLGAFRLTNTDSYKGYHSLMLKEIFGENEIINSQYYVCARKGSKYDEHVLFGLQRLLMIIENTIITEEHVEYTASLFAAGLGGFDKEIWLYVARELNGKIPVRIRALPEGSIVPPGVPMFVIESEDPKFARAVGYLETFLSHLWYTVTVATHSREMKKILEKYLKMTSMSLDRLLFMLHDFGCRGVPTIETAGLGGAAHLVNFRGSDTMPATDILFDYYGITSMSQFSVNATEHSVMTSKGREGEIEVLESLLEDHSTQLLSIVIDSYDQYNATEQLTTSLLRLVKARPAGCGIVLRPDSGEPVDVITTLFAIIGENLKDEITTNEKGYKVFPPYIGIIYGDGLDNDKIVRILERCVELGWDTGNLVFGMGGGLLQKVNRDTVRFAWKCCFYQTADGKCIDVYKDPVDGKGTNDSKASLAGRQKVIIDDGGVLRAVREDDPTYADYEDQLKTVYANGQVVKKYTFDEIRANAAI